jgi:hypothetical protein
MKIINTSLFLFGAVLFFSGCQKSTSEDDNDQTTPKQEQLMASSWKYESAKIDADNNGTGDTGIPAGALQPCQTDNILTFSSTTEGTIDEGGVKCATTDPQSNPFTYTLTNNETVINFSAAIFAGVGGDFKIITLSDTQLALSKSLTIPPSPVPITVIAYFKH